MKCFHPITIKNPKILKGASDFGSITVPCGKCPACLKRKQNDWAYRIIQESKDYPESSYFVTLTYDNAHLPLVVDEFTGECTPTLDKAELSAFIKKLRTYMVRAGYGDKPLRFFGCGEYGSKLGRPHYHLCLFTSHVFTDDDLQVLISSVWNKSDPNEVVVKRVGVESAKYVAKYTCKQFGVDYSNVQPPFALMSRRPAIGARWLDSLDFRDSKKYSKFVVFDEQSTPYAMPKYYKDKTFSPWVKFRHSIQCITDAERNDRLRCRKYYKGSFRDMALKSYNDSIAYEKYLIKQLKDEF